MSEIPQGTPPEARQGKDKPLAEKAVNFSKTVGKVIENLDLTKRQPYQGVKERLKGAHERFKEFDKTQHKKIDEQIERADALLVKEGEDFERELIERKLREEIRKNNPTKPKGT